MILAASIVGSGELIATTTLGAEVGFTALWIIVISCLIKPAVQAELGRHFAYWRGALGLLVMLLMVFAPSGLGGLWLRWQARAAVRGKLSATKSVAG